jgi:hypothetical protein
LGSKNLFPSFGTLQGDAIDSSHSDTQSSGDPLAPDSWRSKRSNPLRVQNRSRTRQALALCAGISQARFHAFDDQRAFEFGDRAQDGNTILPAGVLVSICCSGVHANARH